MKNTRKLKLVYTVSAWRSDNFATKLYFCIGNYLP